MLELVPRLGVRQRYTARLAGVDVAELTLGWFREGGAFEIDGTQYELRREGRMSGAFQLVQEGAVIAEAHKRSAFTNRFDVEYDARRYELVKASSWRRNFELRQNDQVVGTIAPQHAFTRRSEIALPEELPLPVQLFLSALVMLMWNREASAAAGGGGS